MNATAYVLAGGQSRRFGEDKALYEVGGRPLIQRPIKCLSRCFSSVSIVAKDPAPYRSLGVPVLKDVYAQQMPHVGILTGLERAETAWSFFLACDMPLMTREVVTALWQARDSQSGSRTPQAVVPETEHGFQPLAAFYSTEGLDALRRAIQEERSMKGWLSELRIRTVPFDDETPFRNVNRKEDLRFVRP